MRCTESNNTELSREVGLKLKENNWFKKGSKPANYIQYQPGDLIGALEYLRDASTEPKKRYGIFLCGCGKEFRASIKECKRTDGRALKSCGCSKKNCQSKRNLVHGFGGTKIYRTWRGMMDRCYKEYDARFANYGGRGIRVCERWHNVVNFISDMGEKPSKLHSIDRIDVNGDYDPSNCRWATSEVQQNNKRTNIYLTHDGETLSVAQWEKKSGFIHGTIYDRLRRGWDASKAITTPIRSRL